MDAIRSIATAPLQAIAKRVNIVFGTREPWQIAAISATTTLSLVWLWHTFVLHNDTVANRLKLQFFRLARRVPAVRRKIHAELSKIEASFQDDMRRNVGDLEYYTELPAIGLKSDAILELVDRYATLGHYDWRDGRVSGTVYKFDAQLIELVTTVYGRTSYTNPLHSDVFPGICKMEAEVVRMTATLFGGGEQACGTMTTGGTESIMMACKAYRDYARTRGIDNPNLVMPTTAHSGFDKAAQYLGIHVRTVPVDVHSTEVLLAAMERRINRNTIMLVGSAPNFPYGTMDDIEAIAKLGLKYNIPVHVDACLGGFVVVFMRQAGFELRPFDFTVPGVTSISADPHKYGFAPKGCSVIMYSHPKYRTHQFTVTTDWPGGVYGSPTVSGSRSGGLIAACWATLMYFGTDGYVRSTGEIVRTAKYIEAGLRELPGIYVFGRPATSVVAIGSHDIDIFGLSDALCKLGWNLNPLQFPSGIHICVTAMHTTPGVADAFLHDVKVELARLMLEPGKPTEGKMAVYGVAQSLPDRSLVGEFTRMYIDSTYYTPKKCDGQSIAAGTETNTNGKKHSAE